MSTITSVKVSDPWFDASQKWAAAVEAGPIGPIDQTKSGTLEQHDHSVPAIVRLMGTNERVTRVMHPEEPPQGYGVSLGTSSKLKEAYEEERNPRVKEAVQTVRTSLEERQEAVNNIGATQF